MLLSIVSTLACWALFVRYLLSNLSACLVSTLFTSCSSTAPLSGLASLFIMKSSGEMIQAFMLSLSLAFFLRLRVSLSNVVPSGFSQSPASTFSLWSTITITGLFGE